MSNHPLYIVSAGIDPERTREFWETWAPLCALNTRIIYVVNSPEPKVPPATGAPILWVVQREVLGPVGAFALGVKQAIAEGASLIACLHDDVALLDRGWDERVVSHFNRRPACTLAGFSGAEGLGSPGIYHEEKELHQLARQGFFSNMVERCAHCAGRGSDSTRLSDCPRCAGTQYESVAYKHGRLLSTPRKSACSDGFSQIGRAGFLKRAFAHFGARGVAHHAYDSWLGMLAWRWGGECWYLPERCHHAGGRTAVLAPEWHAYAEKLGGDGGAWRTAHEALYEDGRGFLPFRVSNP